MEAIIVYIECSQLGWIMTHQAEMIKLKFSHSPLKCLAIKLTNFRTTNIMLIKT